MVQGQVFLKGGRGGLALFLLNFFKVYHFYGYAFEEKIFFSAIIIL